MLFGIIITINFIDLNMNLKYSPTVRDCLIKLEELGWTEIIDSRFRQKVTGDLLDYYPNISADVLKEVLDLVLI